MSLGVQLRALLSENLGLKLLSLVLAFLLWMFVVGDKRSEMSLSMPLELAGVPADVVIVSRVPEMVRVRVNGPRTLLSSINPQQLSVALDLRGIGPGTSTFENLASRVRLPKHIEVTYISPSSITLEADLKIQKHVRVQPRVRGTPAAGFELVEVRVEPAEVELEGAAKVLERLGEVPTEVLDVAGLGGSETRPVDLSLPDPTLRPVGRAQLRARIIVQEKMLEREFLQVPVTPPTQDLIVSPPAVDVRVQGGLLRTGSMRVQDLSAEVEVPESGPAKGRASVVVTVPSGVRVLAVAPSTVEVRQAGPGRAGRR